MHSKIIPAEPRYSRTLELAQKFIIQENINKLPVNPFAIAIKNNWEIEKVGNIARDINLTIDYLLKKYVKSNDGSAFYCSETKEYKIVYNENVKSLGRQRWTLVHEIGHIVLNHFVDFRQTQITRGGLSETEYEVLEQEADFFASYVLAPPIILNLLNVSSITRLSRICGLSKSASENRYYKYIEWKKKSKVLTLLEKKIAQNFYNFIHKKRCITCGHSFISSDALYCPICGKKRIYWGDGKMIYKGFELGEDGRALMCPKCENEETTFDGDFCIICGSYLVNKCADVETYDRIYRSCETILTGNSRYCYKCGNESTFLQNQILSPWDQAQSHSQVASTQEDDDVPF